MGRQSSVLLAKFAEQLRGYRYDPEGFCENVLGFVPHDGQRQWFRNATATENALTTGNRWGKSWIGAAEIVRRATYRIGWTPEVRKRMDAQHQPYHALNVSISSDQANLVWWKADAMLQNPKASWLVKKRALSPFPRLTLVNDAIIEARSTDNDGRRLLGNSYDFVNWDEAAYEKRFLHVRDNVLRMRLVDRAGTLNYTSTGNGRNDYGRYFLTGLPGEKKDPGLYSQAGSSLENPYVDQSRIAQNAARMSEKMRRQNIEGAIVDAGGNFFDLNDLEAAEAEELTAATSYKFDDDDEVREARVMVDGSTWHSRYPTHRYLHGWDLADKKDFTVGVTIDTSVTPAKVVEFERFRMLGWDVVRSRIRDRQERYRTPKATKIDSTGVGDVVENDLRDIGVEGFKFSGQSKDAMLANLQMRLSSREIAMPFIKVVHDELAFYERDDKDLIQDCVMALGIAAWYLPRRTGANWLPELV